MSKIPALKEQVLKQAKSPQLGNYVWNCGIGPQMGYSFSIIHALAYSFIGFQTMFIASNWNPIYWNTACLIVNSGALEEESDFDEDDDGNVVQKREKTTDYTKTAKALGDIISKGIKVSLVDINNSDYGFKPDIKNNQILFGMKALSGMNSSTIDQIFAGRPYLNIADFMQRCPLNKTAMISLIKAGAFDNLTTDWNTDRESRLMVMAYYISKTCEPKKRITLQNLNGLIQSNLFPAELDLERRTFLFNKYLKAERKKGQYYVFDESCNQFFINNFEGYDYLEVINGMTCILQTKWDKIYQSVMDKVRNWIAEHHDEILEQYNTFLFKEAWDKYAKGNLSSWEMEALCFYYHEHELLHLDTKKYGIINFNSLSSDPAIDYTFKRNGKDIPIYKTFKIAGTIISKNDTRSSISLLTTDGVVTVKFTKDYFAMFGRQISEKQEDGTKKVLEKGWFQRGVKVMVTGFRRDDMFIAKTYSKTATHQLYKITQIYADGSIDLEHERAKGGNEE